MAWLAALGLSMLSAWSRAEAQRVAAVPARPSVSVEPRPVTIGVAPALTVISAPASFETVEISRPSELPEGMARYEVFPTSSIRILGQLEGVLQPTTNSSGTRSVLLTFSIPRRARAGMTEVARVRFTVNGEAVDVPVRVVVTATTGVNLFVPDGARHVVRGGRIALGFRVANTGNREETIELTAIAPPGWEVIESPARAYTLAVNELREGQFVLAVPGHASTGSALVRLVAMAGGLPVAQAQYDITVLSSRTQAEAGPVLSTGLTVVDGPDGSTHTWSAALSGRVTPGIRVSGRYAGPDDRARSANAALLSLRAYRQPATLRFDADDWAVTLGHGGMQLGEVTGSNVSGIGVQSTVRGERWALSAVNATPGSGGFTRQDGRLAGARAEFDAGTVAFTATGSHLSQRGYDDRGLSAFGLGATAASVFDGALSAELAHRRYSKGAGLGYSMQFVRQTPRDNVRLRWISAPGGRAAFAQSAEQVNLSLGRTVTTAVGVFGDYWRSRDDASGASRFASDGLSGGMRLRLTNQLRADVAVRRSQFGATGPAGGLTTHDHSIEANVEFQARGAFARIRSALGSTGRETLVAGATDPLVESGDRLMLDASIGVRAGAGVLSLSGQYDRADPASGSIPERADLSLRAERISLLERGAFRLIGHAELRSSTWLGLLPTQRSISARLEAHLPFGLTVEYAAERNPWFIHTSGGWVHGFRIERAIALPALRAAAQRGVVYRDLNGNGRRDDGESGHAGALISRDGESVVSGNDGSFRLQGAGPIGALDPMSLDRGWIPGRTAMVGGRMEIAVVPVAPIVVILAIADPQGLGIGADALAKAAVMARHSSGRIWVARRVGPDRAAFDALPPGRYTIELDLTDVPVSLALVEPLPGFVVGQGASVAPITISLSPPRFRVRQLDPPRAGGHP